MNLSSSKVAAILFLISYLPWQASTTPDNLPANKDGRAATRAVKQDAEQVISANASDYEWTPMVPQMGKSSPVITVLHEHSKTHSRQFEIRLPPNFHVPAHFHTANETHTVIEGRFVIEANGKRVALGPGGFNYTPGGIVHEAWTPQDTGALIFVTVDGKYDLLQK